MTLDIFQFFSCYTNLPVMLSDVKAQLIETGKVDRIIRKGVPWNTYIVAGGFHMTREIGEDGKRERVARIGYPLTESEGMQRVIQTKEMLHCLDEDDETSPTRVMVDQLVNDLLVEGVEKQIGIPAHVDHGGVLKALAVLLPRDALDELRPAFKNDQTILATIAANAKLPETLVRFAMSDRWAKLLDEI